MNNAELSHAVMRAMGLWLRSTDAPTTIRRSRARRSPQFEVQAVRTAHRVGPDGELEPQVIIEITQERRGYRTAAMQDEVETRGRISGVRADFVFRGGATLIVDLRTRKVRCCTVKDIDSQARLEGQRKFQFDAQSESLGATYYNAGGRSEPFAFLHRML